MPTTGISFVLNLSDNPLLVTNNTSSLEISALINSSLSFNLIAVIGFE